MKTVFLGPWIGEFGWEFLNWSGWVRRVCRDHFKDCRKIVASLPGRKPFYAPYIDEFWPLPEEYIKLQASCHAYFTDGWRDGYPGKQENMRKEEGVWRFDEMPIPGPSIEAAAEAMLEDFRKKLPPDTIYFVPWKWNRYEPDGIEFGFRCKEEGQLPKLGTFENRAIPPEFQIFEYHRPGPELMLRFNQAFPGDTQFICMFPRERHVRRADKNWQRDKYYELLLKLQKRFPQYPIAILGEPGGACFADGVPEGCLDFINLQSDLRFETQLAVLSRSVFSVGGISGAMLVALACGSPSLLWGHSDYTPGIHGSNKMSTPAIFHPQEDPDVETIFWLCDGLQQSSARFKTWTEPVPVTKKVFQESKMPVIKVAKNEMYTAFHLAYQEIHDYILTHVTAEERASTASAFAGLDDCFVLFQEIMEKRAETVVETGTFLGLSALVSAMALQQLEKSTGKKGTVYSISPNCFYKIAEPLTRAQQIAQELGLASYIKFLEGVGTQPTFMESQTVEVKTSRQAYARNKLFPEGRTCLLSQIARLLGNVDVVFLDSLNYEYFQLSEIASVAEALSGQGAILLADAHRGIPTDSWVVQTFNQPNSPLLASVYEVTGGQSQLLKLTPRVNGDSQSVRSTWDSPFTLQEFLQRFEYRAPETKIIELLNEPCLQSGRESSVKNDNLQSFGAVRRI